MNSTQGAIVSAATGRILPSGKGPGAADANVAGYVETALDQPYFQALKPWFLGQLDSLQGQAQERYGCTFVELKGHQQDELLEALQQSPNPMARQFFQTLVTMTLEGFLGDPTHGGNRRQVSWKWLGYRQEEPRSGFCLEKLSKSHRGQ